MSLKLPYSRGHLEVFVWHDESSRRVEFYGRKCGYHLVLTTPGDAASFYDAIPEGAEYALVNLAMYAALEDARRDEEIEYIRDQQERSRT